MSYFKLFYIGFIKLIFIISILFCFICFNFIGDNSDFLVKVIDNYKHMFTNTMDIGYESGVIFLIFLLAIKGLYRFSFDSFIDNVNDAYRDTILSRFILSEEDLISRINSGNDIYVEDREAGLYAKLKVSGSGLAEVEFLTSGKIVKFRFKDLYKDIVKLKNKRPIILYDGDVLSYLYDVGFRMSKN